MPRPTPPGLSDEAILQAVIEIRLELGACTYRTLAARLNLSSPRTVWRWCQRLIAEGRLVASSEPGSLRLAPRRR